MNKLSPLYLALCILTACSQHTASPPQKDLSPATPAQWQNNLFSAQEVLKQAHWWQAFQDPALDQLIQQVLEKKQ